MEDDEGAAPEFYAPPPVDPGITSTPEGAAAGLVGLLLGVLITALAGVGKWSAARVVGLFRRRPSKRS